MRSSHFTSRFLKTNGRDQEKGKHSTEAFSLSAWITCQKFCSAHSTLITVPTAFLVGAFMQMPLQQLADLLSWGQAIRCMRALLNAGVPIGGLIPSILLMVAQICILLALSVFGYARTRLQPE
jgi:hypothetical protein